MKEKQEKNRENLILDRNELAVYLDRSTTWLRKAIRLGLVPEPIKVAGAAGFWTKSMIDSHIEKLAQKGAKPA